MYLNGNYYTVEQVAERFFLTKSEIRRRCKNWTLGKQPALPCVKIAGIWLVEIQDTGNL